MPCALRCAICALDGALPFEAKIAIAGLHRQARNFSGLHARPVNVELLVAETIGPTGRSLHQFGAHDLAVELVRSVPIGDVNHAMIKLRRHSTISPLHPHQPPAFALPGALLHGFTLVVQLLAAGERDLDLRPPLLVKVEL